MSPAARAVTASIDIHTTPSATVRYSRLHRAFLAAAGEHNIAPTTARVLLAVHDRDGKATSPELYDDLDNATMVRRSLLEAYAQELAVGDSIDGGRRRPGRHVRVRLTDAGQRVVATVYERAGLR